MAWSPFSALAGDVTFEVFIGEDLIDTFYAPVVEQSPGTGQAQISVSLPVEVYSVVASIDSDYYIADPDEAAAGQPRYCNLASSMTV